MDRRARPAGANERVASSLCYDAEETGGENMPKLGKAQVAMNGLLGSLVGLIRDWKPGRLGAEIQYRDSLVSFLRASIPEDCRVEREYRHAGTTADAFVSWKGMLLSDEVFIEIKVNLRKKSAYDRLVGQIEGLDPARRKILIVLVGESDDGLVGRLKDKYPTDDDFDDSKVRIVIVR